MGIENILLHEIIESKNMWVPIDSPLHHFLKTMDQNKKGVAVALENGQPVGVLTERDVISLLYQGIDKTAPVEQYARKPLVLTLGNRTLGYALNLMLENNIRRLIVTDEDGRFLGVVTQKDLLMHMEDDFYQATLRIKHVLDQKRNLIAVNRTTTIKAVLEIMVAHNISSVPIMEKDRAVGIITEKDILRVANDNVPLGETVDLYMSKPVYSTGIEALAATVVQDMNRKNIRRIVVNDIDGKTIGLLTNRDFVKNLDGDYNQFLEMKLKCSKEILNLLPEMLIELIDLRDEQLVIWANEKVLSTFGENILDTPITELIPQAKWDEIYSHMLEKGKVGDVRFKTAGRTYEFSGFYLPLQKGSEKGRIQLILRDITEEVIQASVDPLTSVFNRRYTSDFLVKETERSKRMERTFSVIILDIDNFKAVNDLYGHMAGDTVLQEITQCIQGDLRQYDVLGRFGGEEFLIIMPEIDKKVAASAAERIRQKIATREIELQTGLKIQVTVSFGVACFPEGGASPDDLLVVADERLYQAKRHGKNRVEFD